MTFTFAHVGTKYVTLTVTDASNQAATVEHNVVVTAAPPAPSNTALPTISGTAQQSQTLTTSNGTWAGSPTSYGYQWQDCASSGSTCTNISGATSSGYMLTSADVGHAMRAVVTASNGGGSTPATSNASAVVTSGASGPPTASFIFSPSAPVTGSSVQFNGTASTCAAGPCTYTWTDAPPTGGSWPLGTGQTMAFTFSGAGTKYATLTVTDALNRTAIVEHNVVVTAAGQNAPSDTALPTISGTAQQGQTLTASNGSWTGSPTSYAYQWQDCNTSGASCAAIGGATSGSYLLSSGDVGHTVRVAVSATNAGGTTTATSTQTGVVTAQSGASPPSDTALPTISGTATQGQTLTASNGSWTGTPTSYAYQWQDCASSGGTCTNISGATSTSYTLASGDVGHTIRVVVTATNASGSTPATSTQTGIVGSSGGGGCSGAANTPGGADPWGGCFPGPNNTGVPAGTVLTTVNSGETAAQAVAAGAPADNTGWTYDAGSGAIVVKTTGAVVDAIRTPSGVGFQDNGTGLTATVKNSQINGSSSSDTDNNGIVTFQYDTLVGGNQANQGTVYMDYVDVQHSNLSGGKDEINCAGGNHCYATDSYLYSQYTGSPLSHQQGYDGNGMNDILLQHDSIGCVGPNGQCTADITVSTDGTDTHMTFDNNLMLAGVNPGSVAACIYPGPQAPNYANAPMGFITVANNVFQKGATGQCGNGGATAGWYPHMCETNTGGAPPSTAANTSCTWTGNTWDNGAALNMSFQ